MCVIIINMLYNLSGKIFKIEDINVFKVFVIKYDLYVISDEVYEYIIFDGVLYLSVLIDFELFVCSFVILSFGKIFYSIGWKMGYCVVFV